jgi:nucleotide-binding universal stress UspA family protein
VSDPSDNQLLSAVQDFRLARRHADLERLWGRLTGKSVSLLRYEDVRQQLHGTPLPVRELRNVPLDAIVGSVGRYDDFTRHFFPLKESDEKRWSRVELASLSMEGVPPIQLYQIDQVYFVIDGNHRVSVARQLEAQSIEAYVTPVVTKVPLTADDDLDAILLKSGQVLFYERTQLDETRPDTDFTVTEPGRYQVLQRQIALHQHELQEQLPDITFQEVAAEWHDTIFRPIIDEILARGMLRDFPDRTATDLYVWIFRHREQLEQELGWEISAERTVDDLLMPPARKSRWRAERNLSEIQSRLFADTVVYVGGSDADWYAVDQAIALAEREGGRVRGLHVLASGNAAERENATKIETEFLARCDAAGAWYSFVAPQGKLAETVAWRSRWNDLLVVGLDEIAESPFGRLGSAFYSVAHNCPRPILVVQQPPRPIKNALVATYGSKQGWQALYMGAYLHNAWGVELTVVSVGGGQAAKKALADAEAYLAERQISANMRLEKGKAGKRILKVAKKVSADMIILGGYSHKPLVDTIVGSTIDKVLQTKQCPIMICK